MLHMYRNRMSMPNEVFRDDVQNPLHKTTYSWLGGAPFFMRGGGEDFPGIADDGWSFFAYYIEPIHAAETLRDAKLVDMRFARSREWCVFAPYWLILSAFAFTWFVCLLWRGWRRRQTHSS